jgi:hypothetical protein
MDWIIQSKDEISGRTGENRYETEAGFLAALRDIFGDPKKRCESASKVDPLLSRTSQRVGAPIGVRTPRRVTDNGSLSANTGLKRQIHGKH